MKSTSNQITLNLDRDPEVSVKAFIAPIEYTQRNYHVDWNDVALYHLVINTEITPTAMAASSIAAAVGAMKPVI